MYPEVALPLKLEDEKAREGVLLNASEPKIEFKDYGKEWNTVCTRSGRVVKPLVLYMKEYGSNRVEGAFTTIHQDYYTQLYELDED